MVIYVNLLRTFILAGCSVVYFKEIDETMVRRIGWKRAGVFAPWTLLLNPPCRRHPPDASGRKERWQFRFFL